MSRNEKANHKDKNDEKMRAVTKQFQILMANMTCKKSETSLPVRYTLLFKWEKKWMDKLNKFQVTKEMMFFAGELLKKYDEERTCYELMELYDCGFLEARKIVTRFIRKNKTL